MPERVAAGRLVPALGLCTVSRADAGSDRQARVARYLILAEMSDAVIRRTTARDVQAMAMLRRADAIERRSVAPGADPGFEARFAEWAAVTDGRSVAWLAELRGEPVGMLHMFVQPRMPMPDRDTARWAYIGVLFVLSGYRDAGLGTRLLGTALDHATEHGLSRILLHPTERAIPLYRRTGFAPADQYVVWSAADSQPHQPR